LTLLLLLVVIVPSVCLLWFMNRAVQNERLAVQQKLLDLYQGHLTEYALLMNDGWQGRIELLDEFCAKGDPPGILFRMGSDAADSVICFDSVGKVSYPNSSVVPRPEPLAPAWAEAQSLESSDPAAAAAAFGRLGETTTNDALAASACQAQARCLLQARQTNAALSVCTNMFAQEKFKAATDAQGRLIVPNAELMVLELMIGSDRSQTGVLFKRMQTQLQDYYQLEMPSTQRRFLMHRLEELYPRSASFPTLAAEDLAARYLESTPADPPLPGWHPAQLPDVWQLPTHGGKVVLLCHTKRLREIPGRWNGRGSFRHQTLPAEITETTLAPGEYVDCFLSMPVGPTMPGWKIAFSWKDKEQMMDAAAETRITSLLWTAALAVAGIGALGLFAAGLLRRQMAVAQLKNDLVANVTHELKTPLSSMRLLVDTLLNSPSLDEKTARDYLQLIARENLRLSHLIDNFLAFSRIERDKYAFDFHPVPAREIVDSAAAAVRDRFNTPGCRFTVAAAPDLPPVLADSGAMVTALVNLLDNAWKYSGEEKQIALTAGAANGGVTFAVQDNGIGLPAGESSRIFKRFYQVDPHLSRVGSGCGLGLSIVQFIVTAHRGGVKVESRPGAGSTFTITLPAAGTGGAPEAGK
jgi:signal transduction histidine kinase